MEGNGGSHAVRQALLSGLRAVPRRLLAVANRLAFPEGRDPQRHWQRLVMNESVGEHIASLGPPELSAVEVSGDTHAERPWREYESLRYPEFDLCAPLPGNRTYDVVICEQVLEHVVDPWAAAANLRRLCAPGGHVIVSTPFMIRLHEEAMFLMKDYWRFTPRGLETLLEGAGLRVEAVHAWGNRQCVVGNLNRWSARRRWHSLRNEPNFPVQVWAFARNPG